MHPSLRWEIGVLSILRGNQSVGPAHGRCGGVDNSCIHAHCTFLKGDGTGEGEREKSRVEERDYDAQRKYMTHCLSTYSGTSLQSTPLETMQLAVLYREGSLIQR